MGGLHPLEQLGGGKGQHLLRVVLFRGKAEAEAEHLLFGYMLVEQGVMTLYGLFLFLVKPASFAGQKLRLELGVQLLMLYGGGAVYGVLQTDTEERREPVRSTNKSSRLLVPMNEAMRGSAEALRL